MSIESHSAGPIARGLSLAGRGWPGLLLRLLLRRVRGSGPVLVGSLSTGGRGRAPGGVSRTGCTVRTEHAPPPTGSFSTSSGSLISIYFQ